MKFQPYSFYKDSGVDLIGRIPSNWRVRRVSDLVEIINGYPFDSNYFNEFSGIPLLRIRDLNASETDLKYAGPIIEAAKVTSRDVLIGMDGDFNVGRWRGNAIALLNQRVCCLRGREELNHFIECAITSPLKLINDVTYSTTVKHLSSKQIRDIRLALPETDSELSSIILFLNRETSRIAALIAEQEKFVALLREKQRAVIFKAVTKGLGSGAPQVESGIPWIGMMPAGWRSEKLKRISPHISVGVVVMPSQYYVNEGVIALRSFNVQPMKIDPRDPVYFSPIVNEQLAKSKLSTGDLVAVRTGNPGTTAVIDAQLDGVNCIDLIIIRKSESFNSQFLAYVMNSDVCRIQYEVGSEGALHKHFNVETAANLRFVCPEVETQDAIVAYLEKELGRLDELISEANSAIRLLLERRRSLIAAAVTGKIDVRTSVEDAPIAQAAAA